MNALINQSLVLVAVDYAKGLDGLKKCLRKIVQFSQITNLSSVYRHHFGNQERGYRSTLKMIVKIDTQLSYETLLKLTEETSGDLTILTFNQEVQLVPNRNLPHPDLNTDFLVLRCAAEAWGGYEHPIIGKTLNEMVVSQESFEQIEFFSQGIKVIQLLD